MTDRWECPHCMENLKQMAEALVALAEADEYIRHEDVKDRLSYAIETHKETIQKAREALK